MFIASSDTPRALVTKGAFRAGRRVESGGTGAAVSEHSEAAGGGTALTTRYVADQAGLEARGVTAVNFQLQASAELLGRVGEALATGRIVVPPINRISLAQAADSFTEQNGSVPEGKTVIVV